MDYGRTLKEIEDFILYKAGHLVDEETEHRFIKFLEKQKEFLADNSKTSDGEDEKIRKIIRLALIASEDELSAFYKVHKISRKECTDWLEKQKEPHYTKRNAIFDKCVENCDPAIMKRVSDEVDAMIEKEQKPIEPSDDELQRHQDELYDFKVFATKQAKEHRISFVNDFEWNNFCDELLSFFYEKHTTDGKALLHVAEKSYQIGLRDGKMEQNSKPFSCGHENGDSEKQEQPSLPSNLDEAADKFAVLYDQGTCDGIAQDCFKAGAGFAVQRIISLIESRIAEILGDAQPAPVLRAELRGLIDKIKEESK